MFSNTLLYFTFTHSFIHLLFYWILFKVGLKNQATFSITVLLDCVETSRGDKALHLLSQTNLKTRKQQGMVAKCRGFGSDRSNNFQSVFLNFIYTIMSHTYILYFSFLI